MGTPSLTVFIDRYEREIAVLYRQYDGYPSGHGAELAAFLANSEIVNGISAYNKKIFNGMECLAAAVVAHFKDGAGYFYLYPADTRDLGEQYVYYVEGEIGQEPYVEVYEIAYESDPVEKRIFACPASNYGKAYKMWCREAI